MAMDRSSPVPGSSGSSGVSRQCARRADPRRLFSFGIYVFFWNLLIMALVLITTCIMVTVLLGTVLSPLALVFLMGKDLATASRTWTRVCKFCTFLLYIIFMVWTVGWPYIVVFGLGPWSSSAVALAHCTSFIVLTVFFPLWSWTREGNCLRDEDTEIHNSEIPVLESSPYWSLHLMSILWDWFQYSALSVRVPDIKLPPSVQDLLDAFFSWGDFAIPFLPQEVTALIIAFVLVNGLMCAGPMFYTMLVVARILRDKITRLFYPVNGIDSSRIAFSDFSASRWHVAGERLKAQVPSIGGVVFRLLDGADVNKWQEEISTGWVLLTSCLVGVISVNLRAMACVEEGNGQMTLAADRTVECWTPSHTGLALGGGLFLTAFLLAGLREQLSSRKHLGIRTHKWYTLCERPLKLLTVGVAIQSEALRWTRARLVVTSASAAGIALANRALWSTNHAGLNKLRQLTWWSAAICSTSSWLHFEIGDPTSYVGAACFIVYHFMLAVGTFFDSEPEGLLSHTAPMQWLRRFTRLLILLVTVVFASTASMLPQLLAANTGTYVEKDLQMSDLHAITTDSCAIYVRTANCSSCNAPPLGSSNSFQEGVIGGRLKVWGSGRLLEQNSRTTVIAGTDFEACELWLIVPTHAVFSVECNGTCTLHANGVFDGSSVATAIS